MANVPTHPGEVKLCAWGYPLQWADHVLSVLNTDRRVDYTNSFGFSATVYGVDESHVMTVNLFTDSTDSLVWEVSLFYEHGHAETFYTHGATGVLMAGAPQKATKRGFCLDEMAEAVRCVLYDVWDTNWACITL